MSEIKVTYQPIGRLGNQMFQCAAAIGYAKKYHVGWAVPNDTREVPRFHEFFPVLRKYDGHEFRRFNAADPSQFNYSPIPEHPNGVKLVGFFQSEKYFDGAYEEIRKVFKLNSHPEVSDYVSIHVRHGDYLQHPNSFPVITMDYLRRAMYEMTSRGFNKFMVFSDGIEWCKENINGDFEVQFSESKSELEDLSLMSSCSNHIIANSSFSWWGAWLGHNPNKFVVSPSSDNWFGPGFTGSEPIDLIPPSWHQIKFR